MLLSKTRSILRSFSFPTWSVPIALLILTLLSYGLRVFTLGFYWDDWPYLWFFHRLGPSGIIQAFAGDRPFLSFIYIICLSIFGHSVTGWQIFGLLARWLFSLSFWWMLSLAWPRQMHKVTWAVFLFAVYPGFTQQWISVIWAQGFICFAAVFFSIGITLWFARRVRHNQSRVRLAAGTLLALALSAFAMFSTEYFFGMELLRPVLLWLVFSECSRSAGLKDTQAVQSGRWKAYRLRVLRPRALRVAAWWAPYLALMMIFVFWRSFIHVFVGYRLTTLQGFEHSPLVTLRDLSITILKDMITSTMVAWGQPLQLGNLFDAGIPAGLRLLAVILLAGLLTILYLARLRPRPIPEAENTEDPRPAGGETGEPWSIQAIVVGLFAMFAGGWPFWIPNLPLRLEFPQDRFSLLLAAGACLLIAGLVDGLGKNRTRKAIILGIVVGLAVGFHFTNAESYHQDWTLVRDFLWQLSWRAPSIQSDTLLLSEDMPFHFFEDDSLTAPINWSFDPGGNSTQMKYMLYDLLVRYHGLQDLRPADPVDRSFRATQFTGSMTRVLIFYYAPPGCVRILDPVYDADLYNLPDGLLASLALSNPGKLIQDQNPSAAPPADIFGSEPKHRWCYFFEKADLARQNGDWNAVVELSNQSIHKGYRPEDPAEYLPFIEAYNRTGSWEDGYQLTQSAYEADRKLRPALCSVWRRSISAANQADLTAGEQYKKANEMLDCPAP